MISDLDNFVNKNFLNFVKDNPKLITMETIKKIISTLNYVNNPKLTNYVLTDLIKFHT